MRTNQGLWCLFSRDAVLAFLAFILYSLSSEDGFQALFLNALVVSFDVFQVLSQACGGHIKKTFERMFKKYGILVYQKCLCPFQLWLN
jgi:hypothetical protein